MYKLSLLLLVLLSGCRCDYRKGMFETKKPSCKQMFQHFEGLNNSINKPVYIVLCDFTASMDTIRRKDVCEAAIDIVSKYYDKAVIKFYPVTKGSVRPFFETGYVIKIDSAKVSSFEIKIFEDCVMERKQKDMNDLAKHLYQQTKIHDRESYIIQSVVNAISVLKETAKYQKRNNKNRIVILSDMKEYGQSDFGNYNLEDGNTIDDIQELEKNFIPLDTIQSINGLAKINVGFFADNQKERIKQFWNRAFRKIGYTEPVNFSSEINLE